MRESIKDRGRIEHMLDMAFLLEDKKESYSLEDVKNDTILFYGISKIIEIIGEAAYMVSKEFKDSHPQLPWRQNRGHAPYSCPWLLYH